MVDLGAAHGEHGHPAHARGTSAGLGDRQAPRRPLVRPRVLEPDAPRAGDRAARRVRDRIQVHERLLEYDYGEFEGLTAGQIWTTHPGWGLFRDGCPGGETPGQIAERVDAVIEEPRELGGNSLLFGHGHCFRSLAVRFLDLPILYATNLLLDAGTISITSDERDGPALVLWNRRVQPRAMLVADTAAAIARTVPRHLD
jgi:broad specificity phosphatase PhoE